MAGAGYRSFSAGAVLTAAQVNTFLMEQSVMNFAGTAARGSALASVLSAGQMAHVGGGTVTVYDGSAWQQVYPTSPGLVYVAGTAFSAASAVNVNNCFTSTNENYRIVIDTSAASTAIVVSMRLRVSSADNSTTNYNRQNLNGATTAVSTIAFTSQTQWNLENVTATSAVNNRLAFDIFGPQLTRTTTMVGISAFTLNSGTFSANLDAYLFNASTSFDGFSLLTDTGTISGTLRIYGYRNS